MSGRVCSERRGTLGRAPTRLLRCPSCCIPLQSCGLSGVTGVHQVLCGSGLAGSTGCRQVASTGKVSRLMGSLCRSKGEIIFAVKGNNIKGAALTARVTLGLAGLNTGMRLAAASPTGRLGCGLTIRTNVAMDQVSRTRILRTCGGRIHDGTTRAVATRSVRCVRRSLHSPYARRVTMFQTFTRVISGTRGRIMMVSATPAKRALLLLSTARDCRGRMRHARNSAPTSMEGLLPHLEGRRRARIIVIALPRTAPMFRTRHLRVSLRHTKVGGG